MKTFYFIKQVEKNFEEELSSYRSENKAIAECIKLGRQINTYLQKERAEAEKARVNGETDLAERIAYKLGQHEPTRYEVIQIVEDADGECISCEMVFAVEA